MDKYLMIKEASKLLNITKQTLRHWDNTGKFKAYRHPINNYRLYKLSNLEKLLERIEKS